MHTENDEGIRLCEEATTRLSGRLVRGPARNWASRLRKLRWRGYVTVPCR